MTAFLIIAICFICLSQIVNAVCNVLSFISAKHDKFYADNITELNKALNRAQADARDMRVKYDALASYVSTHYKLDNVNDKVKGIDEEDKITLYPYED